MIEDSTRAYGSVTRFLHWSMALCYLFVFSSALAWNLNEHLKFLLNPHRAIGFLLLMLSCVRVAWGISQIQHRPPNHIFAKLGHWALHALMLIVPVFGLMRQMEVPLGRQHGVLAFVLLFLVFGHIMMAVMHQIKGEKILNRIWGRHIV